MRDSVLQRHLAKSKTKRNPIKVSRGWHVTPTKNVSTMLRGVQPISRGMPDFGEAAANKTYFFREFDPAVYYMFGRFEEEGDPIARRPGGAWVFSSGSALKYQWAILELDLSGLTSFADQEEPIGNGFTVDVLPASRVKLVPVSKWLPLMRKYIWKEYRQKFGVNNQG